MKEREAVTITGLVIFLSLFWLGFLVHQSPRFAGSFWGGVLGVSGATLMLVPLAYLVIKRVNTLKQAVTRHVSIDRKSTRLNSSHTDISRMPSSA